MSLMEQIQKDLTDAMRAKDELRLSVVRMIKAAIKHKEIEKIRAAAQHRAFHPDTAQHRAFAQHFQHPVGK